MPKCGRRNELPEFQFLQHPKESDYVLKNAPFGTTLTPSTRMKIVGSKPVFFVDDSQGNWDGNTSPRPIRKTVADKPNHIDPWEIKATSFKGYSTAEKDHFNSHLHSPRYGGKELSPYKVIPPIERRELARDNERSSFEESPGDKVIKNRQQNNVNDNLRSHDVQLELEYTEPQDFSEKEHLLRLLPRGVYLPKEPLRLGKEDEWRLLCLLNQELRDLDGHKLKDIYLELTKVDKQLRGWCHMQDLSYTLGRHRIFLSPDILRLVSCLFVSDQEPGRINYEKILSFFGTALRTSIDEKPAIQERLATQHAPSDSPAQFESEALPPAPHPDKPTGKYYVPKQQTKPVSGSNDSEKTMLIRLIEQQMEDSGVVIDFDNLMRDFRKMDPNHRQTVSAAQVKQIVYSPSHQIPLQESLIDQILAKCEHHGDGQYNWLDFIEFLERIQPRQTGLILPKSKRPLDYAKVYAKPSSNWPHAEEPGQNIKEEMKTPLPTYARDYNGNVRNQYDEDGRVSQLEIERKEFKVKEMERELELMKRRVNEEKDETDPWFQRFLKLASAVYSQDVDNSGHLPYDEVKQLLTLYNDAYNLRIPEHEMDRAMMDHFNRGNVAIHDMLTKLGARGSPKT